MKSIIIFLAGMTLCKSNLTSFHLMSGQNNLVDISSTNGSSLTSFCWNGVNPTVNSFWSSAHFQLQIGNDEYKVYFGVNNSEVERQANSRDTFWYPQLIWKSKKLRFNIFKDCCYGILTAEPYQLHLQYQTVNFLLVFLTMFSITMFLLAPFLSRSTTVHYTAWITMGIFFSLVCLTFLLQKRFRQSFFSWVFLAYSLSIYLMSNTLYSLNTMLSPTTLPWFVGYCLVTALVSWAALYRLGPPSHPRTLALIQWSVQGLSLVTMALSSYNTKASIAAALVLLLGYALPFGTLLSYLPRVRISFRRPKRQLLTEAQLMEQSDGETRLALERLRRYCLNSEGNAWGIVSKLRSPGRFAEFVEGGSHVTTEEVEEYNRVTSEEETTDTTECDISLETIENEREPDFGHRFSCFLCNPSLLGHRFSCAQCITDS